MDKSERIAVVKAMEKIVRCINDEHIIMLWLSLGIADGDIKNDTPDDELDYYIEDEIFAELMKTFLDIMSEAQKSGGLYVDGVLSTN